MKEISFELSSEVKNKIKETLLHHGINEIGGIIIGRKEAEEYFKIIDVSISIEEKSLSFYRFFKSARKSQKLLNKHFKNKTGYYIGEWHSHPSFSLNPSITDAATMFGIVRNSKMNINFCLLLIVKLMDDELLYKAFFFHKDLDNFITLKEKALDTSANNIE
jgi:integrative and conjugative element protein (TIGR02256 family)